MAEFYLVRHGQASFGTDNYDRLSSLGKQQSFWLGQYFGDRNIQFDRIITGTQVRHRETAQEICRGMGCTLPFVEEPGLNEYDFYGLFKALGPEHADLRTLAAGDKHQFYKGLKQVLHLWATDQLSGKVAESWHDFTQRVRLARQSIQSSGAKRVLVVSSGGPVGMMARQVLQAPEAAAIELNLQVRNTSFSHYYFNQQSVRLASFNNIPHLDHPDRLHAISHG